MRLCTAAKTVEQLEVFREDIPRAAQYVNSDSVLQQCILCRLDIGCSYLFAVNKEWWVSKNIF